MNRLKFSIIAVGCLSLLTVLAMAQRGGYGGTTTPARGGTPVGQQTQNPNDVGSGAGFRNVLDTPTPAPATAASPSPTPKGKVSPTPRPKKGKQNHSTKVSPSPTASPKK